MSAHRRSRAFDPPRAGAAGPRASLLELAIAASAAVLPVMLGVVLFVAEGRQAPRADAASPERHLGVRQVAALRTFEQAVVVRAAAATGRHEPDAAALLQALPACRDEWGGARWSLAAWRDGEAAPAQQVAERLAQLDAALLRFSTRANARVAQPLGLDVARWADAAQRALAVPIETPQYPGQRFALRCADLDSALRALLRADARMLEALAWRGTEGPVALARWRADQQVAIGEQHVARRNPWNGVAGCVYLGGAEGRAPTHYVAATRSAQRRLCGLPALHGAGAAPAPLEPAPADGALAPDAPGWQVPPSLDALLRPLEALRQPSAPLYRLYTEGAPEQAPADAPGAYRYGPNRIALDGAPVDVGFSLALTIDPALQALAQKTAACYTGRHEVCRALGLRRADEPDGAVGRPLLEGAMVRMAAVAVVDVASGRIEALAGALSPCARQSVDGPGREAGCDRRLPYPVRFQPDALLNPAAFHDAMPASTIKPIMAAAFLSDPEVGARWLAAEQGAVRGGAAPARESLRGQLMRSDSARFLDRMFCLEKGFRACDRPWRVQAAAHAFGWNAGCDDARADCGARDLLFGRSVDARGGTGEVRPLATVVPYGRLLSEPPGGALGAAMHLMPRAALDADVVRRCALGADGRRLSADDWEKCRGGAVVDVVAEGWGQGHARASALGVAGMMATLAAAANGQPLVRRPHLVASVRGVGASNGEPGPDLASAVQRWRLAEPQPHGLARGAAEVVLSGLAYSHRAGTARTACEQVFDARRCRAFDWLAGKTGTPSFPGDGVSLDTLARVCAPGAVAAGGGPATSATSATDGIQRRLPPACNALRPYKWYVAAYRDPARPHGPWTKAIAVLAERNWLRASGQVHGAGDHGPNPAAEIALQVAGRHIGLIAASAP